MILEVEQVSKRFHRRGGRSSELLKAVEGVSFALEAGETFGLVGESGSGKTTLARCILGLHEPDAGAIRFLGQDIFRLRGRAQRLVRCEIQSIFQDPLLSLNPGMTARQIIEEPLLIHRMGDSKWRRARVDEMLRAVGLPASSHSRYPAHFSGGQRQRIAIARALAPKPRLVVADEPVSALDQPVRTRILSLLDSLKVSHRLSLLFITHAIELVRQHCDRGAVMYRGRFVELARVEDLFSRPQHPYTRFLLATHQAKTAPLEGPSTSTPGELLQGVSAFEERLGELHQVSDGHWVAS